MPPEYLIDASALYPLILRLREKLILRKELFSILDLTIYEVGNTLLKEWRKGRIRDLGKAVLLFEEMLTQLKKLSIESLEEVLSLAAEKKLTFYDAAYLHVAEKQGLKLITEDREIITAYPKAIRTDQLTIR